MMGNRFIAFCFFTILTGTLLLACTKITDSYEQFIKEGEIYYPARAQNLQVFPGRNRVQLTWNLVSDPKITKTVLYWNNKTDSIVIPVTRSAGTDTIKTMVSSLAEGVYTFEVFNYDNKGHRSIKVDTIGNVYGNNYDISLVNRAIKTAAMFVPSLGTKDSALVEFYPVSSGNIGVDLRYKNTIGDSVFKLIRPTAVRDTLLKFKKGEAFKYRSLYKPEPNAIDTFFTAYESRTIN